MKVILLGTPISYVFIGLNNVMRATGYPTKAMLSSIITVVANVIIAPIFIFVLGWGIRGAALATLVSQVFGLVWVLHHFLDKNSFVHFDKNYMKFKLVIVGRMFSIGMSPFLMNVCACLVVIIINRSFIHYGGDMAVGAYGVVNRVLTLFTMIVIGITQGMQPIIGYNFGARQFDRVRRTLVYGIAAGMIVTSVGFIMAQLFPAAIVGLFTTDALLTEMSINGLRISCVMFTFVGGQIVISNFSNLLESFGINIPVVVASAYILNSVIDIPSTHICHRWRMGKHAYIRCYCFYSGCCDVVDILSSCAKQESR